MKQQPFFELAEQIILSGGWIMIPLFILGFMAFYICGRLTLYFYKFSGGKVTVLDWILFFALSPAYLFIKILLKKKVSIAQCEEWVKDPGKAIGSVGQMIRYSQEGDCSTTDIHNRFSEIRTAEVPRLQQGVTLLQIFINTAPLMGLLGTVLGMLHTFYGISLGGNESTTSIVAEGIKEALITTQMGLTLAIPGYVMVYFLKQKIIDFETFLVRIESVSLQAFQRS